MFLFVAISAFEQVVWITKSFDLGLIVDQLLDICECALVNNVFKLWFRLEEIKTIFWNSLSKKVLRDLIVVSKQIWKTLNLWEFIILSITKTLLLSARSFISGIPYWRKLVVWFIILIYQILRSHHISIRFYVPLLNSVAIKMIFLVFPNAFPNNILFLDFRRVPKTLSKHLP